MLSKLTDVTRRHQPYPLLVSSIWDCSDTSNQNLDCKTVGFFLKISKEIGKAWRKSLKRANGRMRREKKPVFLASLPSLTLRFQPRSRPFV